MKRLIILLNNNFHGKIMVLFISGLFFLSASMAQEVISSDDSISHNINRVRFVNKFPSDKKVEEKGIIDRLGEFIFGKKQEVKLVRPISVLADNPEHYWVLDQGLESIIEIKNNVGEIPHVFERKYSSLVGICRSPYNEIFFSDSRLNKIFVSNLKEGETNEFITSSNLSQPTGIAYSSLNDELWVVETAAHRISIFDKQGKMIRQIGKRGELPGEFNFPTFIWIDKSGTIYIVDSMNFRIQILNNKGEVISVFGKVGDATGYFSRPKGIATDSFGNIYVVDALFHAVQIFDKKGNLLYHFGRQGIEDGQFWMPTGIYIDDNDYIYITDSYNLRTQVFQLINGQLYDSSKN